VDKPLVEITFDKKKLENIRRMLADVPRGMPKVMSRAINKTATSARAELVKRLRERLNLKQKRVRQYVLKPTKATYKRWISTIRLSRRSIPLIHFGARALKGKGVSFQIYKGGGRKRIITPPTSAFIQTMPGSGHKGVFRRRPGGAIAASSLGERYIYELKGPSIATAFEGAAGMAAQAQWWAAGKLEKNIDAQVAHVLNKWRSAGRAAG